jgi:pyruvate/2-oxoglutarate dehydrogenase complex dihydrolipoamide acyltransferase (E2) component
LGVAATTKEPVWSDEVEAFIPISRAQIVGTFDHRVIDGGDAGRLLGRVSELLQRPEYL